ncbi:Hsp20/alpha crystallin family protein [Prolixibacteraceae bacterium JC049]|nr:Hsp20/alpha crystallin family protein [Prolixibacteraceae bacterium JC049]
MNIVRFNNNVDRVFNSWMNDFAWDDKCVAQTAPAAKVVENEEGFEILMAVPGLTKSDISIQVEKNILNISGKDEEGVNADFVSKAFKRSYRLGENIDLKKVDAKLENGILKITLVKKEKEAPVSVEIDVK